MSIEKAVEEQQTIWGEYHPYQRIRGRSCVMVRKVGCVFIGTVEQCNEYIKNNAHKYEK